MDGIQGLLATWNNVEIVRGFLRFLTRRLSEVRLGGRERTVASILELGESFADSWLGYGDQVVIRGRLSRFAPLYFPVAYSPQIPGALTGGPVLLQHATLLNPAPSSVGLRHVEGGILAFLFPLEATGTPRITSPVHMDRVVMPGRPSGLPYSRADPSLPVLLDHQQLKWLEDKVELRARLRPLDEVIQAELEGTREDFVRLYYHGFYRSEWFPDHGFMLDARAATGGDIRQVDNPTPFMVNLAVESAFETKLDKLEIIQAAEVALDGMSLPEIADGMMGSRCNYTPAYLSSTGYEIMQVNRLPVAVHLAHDRQALQVSILSHAQGDLAEAASILTRFGKSLTDELRRRDPSVVFDALFASEKHLARQAGLDTRTG